MTAFAPSSGIITVVPKPSCCGGRAWPSLAIPGPGVGSSHKIGTHQAELARSTAPVKKENRNRHHMTCAATAGYLSLSSRSPNKQAW